MNRSRYMRVDRGYIPMPIVPRFIPFLFGISAKTEFLISAWVREKKNHSFVTQIVNN